MKVTKRQVRLLKCLNECPSTTVKAISNRLDVSVQTVKSEVRKLTELFNSYDISMELSQGNKLNINGIENLTKMLKSIETLLEFSLENQILLLLVLNKKFLTCQNIADELYVSKSLIEKQIAILLKKHGDYLQSVRHYGIKYASSYAERAQLFVKLIQPYIYGVDFIEEVKQFHETHFSIMDYFTHDQVKKSIKTIEFIQYMDSFSFTDESIKQLFLYMLFFINYNEQEKHTSIGDTFVTVIKGITNPEIYIKIVEQLNEKLLLELDEKEKYYICYLLLSLRKQKIIDNKEIILEMSDIIYYILNKINEYLEINLCDDRILFEGLALHIYTTVLRKDMLKPIDEFYSLKDVKSKYTLGFEMSTITADVIRCKYEYVVSENEMIYLTFHFQAAVERMKLKKNKVKTIIVCHYGVAAANLISAKIERLNQEIEIINTYSMQEFLKLGNTICDLILTTEKIPDRNIPIIYVTPDLKEVQLENISNFAEKKKVNSMLSVKIMEAQILNIKNAKSVKDIISKMINPLLESNYVTKEYYKSVIEREKISSTSSGNIAVPHGNPDYVKETKLVICRLESPIKWSDSYVKYIFLFAFPKQLLCGNQSVFYTFYRKLARPELEDYLLDLGEVSDTDFKRNLANLIKK